MKVDSRVGGLAATTIVVLIFSLVLVAPSAATPFARFTANVTSGPAPLIVAFTDQTYGWETYPINVSWAWDFGDGSTSSDPDPEHTFEGPGKYLVRLVVTGDPLITEPEATTTILVGQPTLDASFDYEANGLTVSFTDTSTGGVTGWFWEFGDGATSNERNPEHTYAGSGSYTVRLGVSGRGDERPRSQAEQTLLVEPTPNPAPARPPVADFSFTPAHGTAPLGVAFQGRIDDSGGPGEGARWTWGFGDRSPPAEGREVNHTFAEPGTYTVRLTVLFSGLTDYQKIYVSPGTSPVTATAEHTITVEAARLELDAVKEIVRGDPLDLTGSTNLPAGEDLLVEVFPASYRGDVSGGATGTTRVVAGGSAPNTFRFTAETTGFGPGTYTAAVRAVAADATATTTFALVERLTDTPTATITTVTTTPTASLPVEPGTPPPTPPPVTTTLAAASPTTPPVLGTPAGSPPAAAFTWSSDPANGLKVQFTDTSTGDVTARRWEFGDGNVSLDEHPFHVYPGPGTYAVLLAVEGPGGATSASRAVAVGSPGTPPVTATSVAPTVTTTTAAPTATGGGGGDPFPWWLAATAAVGLLAGAGLAKFGPGASPPVKTVPGLTIEPRGRLRRPATGREARIEIEARGGIRRER